MRKSNVDDDKRDVGYHFQGVVSFTGSKVKVNGE